MRLSILPSTAATVAFPLPHLWLTDLCMPASPPLHEHMANKSSGDLGITRDEMEQWQAGYVYKPKDTTTDSSTKPQPAPAMPPQPNKTVMREGGGKKWEDKTLLEWDPSHYRLFVGNLAGEVTDDTLQRSFKQYPSLVKARVIRDKRTTKSKGYGFVSFSDGSDYMAAGKDMHEKYIGGRPVQIKRAKASIVPVDIESEKKKGKGNKKDAGGHANTGAGVTKKYKRTPVSHPSGLKPIA